LRAAVGGLYVDEELEGVYEPERGVR